jgi:PAS domain S-box-containing protein
MAGSAYSLSRDTASLVVESAVESIQRNPMTFADALDDIPAALYVTDTEGTITYYNQACISLAGRTPSLGRDKWCVTWRIYTQDGDFVPHDQCPMAVSIREKRPIRDVEAIAERPDGSRVHFIPFPTPLFDGAGQFAGAINLLLDVTEQRKPEYLQRQARRCRQLAAACTEQDLADTLQLMASKYDEQSLKLARHDAATPPSEPSSQGAPLH